VCPKRAKRSSRQSLDSDREATIGDTEETKVKKAIREKVVHVRLSEEEFLALQAFSAKAGSNVSAVLRSLSQQVTADGSIHRRDDRSAIKAYIGELRAIRGILDGIACDLRRGNEQQFDVLIDGMERLIRLVSDHASDLEVMSDATRHQDREEEAGNV